MWTYFLENHLRIYLETYDHRCPVCRLDLRNTYSNLVDTSSNTTPPLPSGFFTPVRATSNVWPTLQTMIRDISNQTSSLGTFEISGNSWVERPPTNNTGNNNNLEQFNNMCKYYVPSFTDVFIECLRKYRQFW